MAHYAVALRRTASTTLSVGTITAAAASPRRARIWEILIGSEAAPADAAFLFQVQRCTTTGTRTAVTPQPLDPADAATSITAGENLTVEPTYTANQFLLHIPMNQRTTVRWQVDPNDGLVIPAVANNGLGIKTPTAPAALVTTNVLFREL